MAGVELPPTITSVSAEEAWNALGRAYLATRGAAPSRETLACLAAQWALETGWGKEMRCFNVGNVKATPKWAGDFAFFATSERLSPEAAQGALNRAGQRPDGTPDVAVPDWTPNEKGKVRVLFYPRNPATKFRAFPSLDQGAAEQIRTLNTSFPTTLPALESGDPDAWARALHRARYYTADPDVYADTLGKVHADLLRRNYAVPTSATPPTPPTPPTPNAPPAPPTPTPVGAGAGVGVLIALVLAAILALGSRG